MIESHISLNRQRGERKTQAWTACTNLDTARLSVVPITGAAAGPAYNGCRWDRLLDTAELVRAKRDDIQRIAARHGARNIRLFGSVARGDSGPQSDIDFLIDTTAMTSSWFPAGLILDLQDLLGRRVEVVTEQGLDPLIRDRVLHVAVPL
jgi:predicted nucleotidyltransferase